MRICLVALLACLGLMSFTSVVRADDDLVDNPSYLAWVKYPLNSSETLDGVIDNGQMQIPTEMVRTLTDKNDDRVVVSTATSITIMGQVHATPAHPIEIKAKEAKRDVEELGNEKVKVGDKEYDCKVIKAKGMNPKDPGAFAKIWVNSDIPGGLVKMVATTSRGSLTYTLSTFTIAK